MELIVLEGPLHTALDLRLFQIVFPQRIAIELQGNGSALEGGLGVHDIQLVDHAGDAVSLPLIDFVNIVGNIQLIPNKYCFAPIGVQTVCLLR